MASPGSYSGYSEHYHQQPEVYQYDSSPIGVPKQHYSDLETVRHSNYNYGAQQPPPNEKEQRRKICGLRTVTFFLVLALITAILCIAAVGGGLGGALASKSSSSGSSPTRTITASATGPIPAASSAVPTYGFARLYCQNHTIYEAPTGARFKMYCGIDWADQDEAKDGGTVNDLVKRSAASWHDCMNQCAAYNKNNKGLASDEKCNAAAFHADLTTSFALYGCNCWFKSAAGARDTVSDTDTMPEQYAVAELLSD